MEKARWSYYEVTIDVTCPGCGDIERHNFVYPVGASTECDCGVCGAKFYLEAEEQE
jgi:hypothetical protein